MYLDKPESTLVNEMCKFLWDFYIQMDHPILARRLDLVLIDMKKYLMDFGIPMDHKMKIKDSKKKNEQILGPC